MTQRVLVTGGAGYVGSVCAEELLRQGYEVTIVDDLSTGHRHAVPKDAEFCEMDIGDATKMRSVLAAKTYDAVFHFAAKALIPESVTNPADFYRVNVVAATTLIDAVREAGIKRFVFSSTAAVYGNPVETPIPEDHPKAPVNSYGETKLAYERLLGWYSRAYGISVCAFRYFNASGATLAHGEEHEPETHILPILFEASLGEREFFTIYGSDYPTPDGSCVRDYVHVIDIAQAHILALGKMESAGFSVYNIGLGKSYSVREVHAHVERIIGRKIPLREGERRAGDPAVLCASPTRLMSELGWSPRHSSLEHIIETAWAWKMKMHARGEPATPDL
jgi:UDP-glucose-4-epimerase GalE